MPLRRGDRTGVAPLLTALWRRARAPPALHPHSPSRQPCRAHTCSAPCPGTRGTRRRKGEGARAAPPRTHAPLVRQCVLDDGAPNRDEGPPLAWHAGVRGGTPRGSLSPPVPVSQPVVVASADRSRRQSPYHSPSSSLPQTAPTRLEVVVLLAFLPVVVSERVAEPVVGLAELPVALLPKLDLQWAGVQGARR